MKKSAHISILAAITVAALFLQATGTQAVPEQTLLTNTSLGTNGAGTLAGDLWRAAGFATGSDACAVTSVTANILSWTGSDQTVYAWLYTDNGGSPGGSLAEFSSVLIPAGQSGLRTFSLPRPFLLAPSTSYWFVLSTSEGGWGNILWAFATAAPTGVVTQTGARHRIGGGGWEDVSYNSPMWSLQGTPAASFTSDGVSDGHIVEDRKSPSMGKTAKPKGFVLMVGDDKRNSQVMSVLHFDTSSLPDTAVITSATLKIRRLDILGDNPLSTHGSLQVDVASPAFGAGSGLERTDFEASPGASNVGAFDPSPADGDWYSASLGAPAFPHIHLAGTTQFRLAFSVDDDDDRTADLFRFHSGEARTAADRPVLVVTYYIP